MLVLRKKETNNSPVTAAVENNQWQSNYIASIQEEYHGTQGAPAEAEGRVKNASGFGNAAPVMIWMAGSGQTFNYFNQPWLEATGRSIQGRRGTVAEVSIPRLGRLSESLYQALWSRVIRLGHEEYRPWGS